MVTLEDINKRRERLSEEEKEQKRIQSAKIPQRRFGSRITRKTQQAVIKAKERAGQKLVEIRQRRQELKGFEKEIKQRKARQDVIATARRSARREGGFISARGISRAGKIFEKAGLKAQEGKQFFLKLVKGSGQFKYEKQKATEPQFKATLTTIGAEKLPPVRIIDTSKGEIRLTGEQAFDKPAQQVFEETFPKPEPKPKPKGFKSIAEQTIKRKDKILTFQGLFDPKGARIQREQRRLAELNEQDIIIAREQEQILKGFDADPTTKIIEIRPEDNQTAGKLAEELRTKQDIIISRALRYERLQKQLETRKQPQTVRQLQKPIEQLISERTLLPSEQVSRIVGRTGLKGLSLADFKKELFKPSQVAGQKAERQFAKSQLLQERTLLTPKQVGKAVEIGGDIAIFTAVPKLAISSFALSGTSNLLDPRKQAEERFVGALELGVVGLSAGKVVSKKFTEPLIKVQKAKPPTFKSVEILKPVRQGEKEFIKTSFSIKGVKPAVTGLKTTRLKKLLGVKPEKIIISPKKESVIFAKGTITPSKLLAGKQQLNAEFVQVNLGIRRTAKAGTLTGTFKEKAFPKLSKLTKSQTKLLGATSPTSPKLRIVTGKESFAEGNLKVLTSKRVLLSKKGLLKPLKTKELTFTEQFTVLKPVSKLPFPKVREQEFFVSKTAIRKVGGRRIDTLKSLTIRQPEQTLKADLPLISLKPKSVTGKKPLFVQIPRSTSEKALTGKSRLITQTKTVSPVTAQTTQLLSKQLSTKTVIPKQSLQTLTKTTSAEVLKTGSTTRAVTRLLSRTNIKSLTRTQTKTLTKSVTKQAPRTVQKTTLRGVTRTITKTTPKTTTPTTQTIISKIPTRISTKKLTGFSLTIPKKKKKKGKKTRKFRGDDIVLAQGFTSRILKLKPVKIPKTSLRKTAIKFQTIGLRRTPVRV